MVSAASFGEAAKLTASDAAEFNNFGSSVSVDGDTMVVGAWGDDDGSGSAYVFTRSGTTWIEQQKLMASDATASDYFGYSVSVYGDTIVVGAVYDNDGGSLSGSAYVFTRSGTTWTEQQKLTASDAIAWEYFGYSVSVYGDVVVVGAHGDDDGNRNSGSAYVFTRSGTTWTEQQKLTASDAAALEYFGSSVSVDGDTMVVGAWGDDDGSGSAYVFTRSGTTWTEQQKLMASDAAAWEYFGYSVSVAGDMIVVGAWGDDDGLGSAYVFTRSGMTWTEQQKLTASDAAAHDYFGYCVSVYGDTIVISASNDDYGSSSGSAYVFTRSGMTWTEQQKLTASDAAARDYFSYSVSVNGDTIVVGAKGDDDGGSDSGSAYVFTNLAITSCDDSEAEQYSFNLSEDVYCFGKNLAASTSVDIYVVNNKDVWKDGDALTDVSGGHETETTGDDGSISTTLIWGSPLTQGSYDIVVDTNQNGKWNKGEPIDDIVSVGFEAIPEFPSIVIPVTAMLGLMFLFSHRKRKE